MELFSLPASARVNQAVPKKVFDKLATAPQKKLFTDLVQRITWAYKLAPETVNLDGKEIKEIQVFKVELKKQEYIDGLLELIDKTIPYPIVFVVFYGSSAYLSASAKHENPGNENRAVVDWTFRADWFEASENKYKLILKNNLDGVFLSFCQQMAGEESKPAKSLRELTAWCQQAGTLNREAAKLRAAILRTSQFNKKVELNMKLKQVEEQIRRARGR